MNGFGTPNGAGPGSASEYVGFDGPGTPGPVGPVAPVAPFFTAVDTDPTTLLPTPCTSCPTAPVGPVAPDEGFLRFLCFEDPGCDDGCEVVVVDDGPVGPLEPVGEVVTVTEGVVDADGEQFAEINVSPGGTNDEGATPGAASLIVNVADPPVGNPTTNTHVSADADGIAATAIVVSTEPTVMAAIFSLRLFDTLL